MNQITTDISGRGCSPVFSIAGVLPGTSETGWKTAYPNPDAAVAHGRSSGHGSSFSIAGVMPASPATTWRTAMPDPSSDVLDDRGYVVTKLEAKARTELVRPVRALHAAA